MKRASCWCLVALAGLCIQALSWADPSSEPAQSDASYQLAPLDGVVPVSGADDDVSNGKKSMAVTPLRAMTAVETAAPRGPATYSTGFENPPYNIGNIDGQDGWFNTSANATYATVSNVNPNGGAQHMRHIRNASLGNGALNGSFSPVAANAGNGPFFAEMDVSISNMGGADYFVDLYATDLDALATSVRFLYNPAQIAVADDLGAGPVYVNTGAAWNTGVYRTLRIEVYPAANQINYYYNGALIYRGVTLGVHQMQEIDIYNDNWQLGGETADFDNLSFGSLSVSGACCNTSAGTCTSDTPSEDCVDPFKTFYPNTSCIDSGCAVLTGGCCIDGECSVETEADCLAEGGSYLGDDTDCVGVSCPDPSCPTLAYANPVAGAAVVATVIRQHGQEVILIPGNHQVCQVRARVVGQATVDFPVDSPFQIIMRIYRGCPNTSSSCLDSGAELLYGPAMMDAALLRTADLTIQEGVWTVPLSANVFAGDNIEPANRALTIQYEQFVEGTSVVLDDSQPTIGLTPSGFTLCAPGAAFGCSFTYGAGRTEVSQDVYTAPITVTGSCCDLGTGLCADDVTIDQCSAIAQRFTPEGECQTPDPDDIECDILAGACCDLVAGTCEEKLIFDCATTAGVQAFGLGVDCEDAACPSDCDEGSTGQPYDYRAGRAISDINPTMELFENVEVGGLRAADNFTPSVDGSISTVRWWGVYNNPLALTPCASPDVPDNFTIKFHIGAFDLPFGEIASYTNANATITRTATGLTRTTAPYGAEMIHVYEATLNTPVAVTADLCYWLEIYNNTDGGNCIWRWVLGPAGDVLAAQDNDAAPYYDGGPSGSVNIGADLAWCLDIQVNSDGCDSAIELPGTCCLLLAPYCDDTLTPTECANAGGRFVEPLATCPADMAGLRALCGGACCTEGDCTIELESVCNDSGGIWQGFRTTCDANPCSGSCCLSDGFCIDNLNQLDCEVGFLGSYAADGLCATTLCATNEICGESVTNELQLSCGESLTVNNRAQAVGPAPLGPQPPLSCFGGGASIGEGAFWVSFVGTGGEVEISTCSEDLADTILSVYTNPLKSCFDFDADDEIACSEDDAQNDFVLCPDPLQSRVCVETVNGQLYYVQVTTFSPADVGLITVNMVCPCSEAPVPECDCPGDVNGDTSRDGADIQAFVDCLLGSGTECACADADENGDVEEADIATFVGLLLNSTGACP